ncbi:hypothetical protein [Actinacidiphila yeochonensis]|uniref:hypothetical protein n=1 Tax=Actinacidiphila yeochonensis TaxID=89050 RepID=UPI0006917A24|nr:hypothetical protein [Actinacidiphila yeochonensis]
MPDFTFELEPFDNQAHHGYRGVAGPYGEAMVFYVKPLGPVRPNQMMRVELVGEHLPETRIEGIGARGQPSTHKARIEIAGTPGTLSYNSLGMTRAARALTIGYAGRQYAFTYLKRLAGDKELTRPGVRIVTKEGGLLEGVGSGRHFTVHGDADETDLAIAIALQSVDTTPLMPGVAVVSAFLRSSANSAGG